MQEYERFRTFTRDYPGLQGLRIVPIGFFMLIVSLQRFDLPLLGSQGDCTITLPLLILCGFLWGRIGRYYERNYGKVEPIADRTRKRMAEIGLFGGFIAVIVLENALFRGGVHLPVSLTELVIGIVFLLSGVQTQRWYYTFSGLVMLCLSCLPLLFGKSVGDPVVGTGGLLFEILFGLTILMVGFLDHLRLIRAFHPTQEAGNARNS